MFVRKTWGPAAKNALGDESKVGNDTMKMLDIEVKGKEVVVFQMGKVASTAIVASLMASGIKATQPHFLSMNSFLTLLQKFEDPDFLPWTAAHTLGQIRENVVIHNRVQKQKKYNYREPDGSSTLKIITVAREPLGWYLSNVVQHYPEYMAEIDAISEEDGGPGEKAPLDEKIRHFLREVTAYFTGHVKQVGREALARLAEAGAGAGSLEKRNILVRHCMIMLRPVFWFQDHFDPIIGTDFDAIGFDKDTGYGVVREKSFDILLLRFEDISSSGQNAIGRFVGLPDFRLEQKNVSADKEIGLAVKNAMAKELFPAAFLNKIFSNPYCEKFYSNALIDGMKKKYGDL